MVGFYRVDEALKCVQVSLIIWNHRSWITPAVNHTRHRHPFIIENVKFFAIINHHLSLIASTHNIYESIFEIVMSSERCPTDGYWLKLLDFVGKQMILKYVCDCLRTYLIHIIAWDYHDPVIRHIDGPSVLEWLIQLELLLITLVLRLLKLPFEAWLGAGLCVLYNLIEIFVHEKSASILEKSFLLLYMRGYFLDAHIF